MQNLENILLTSFSLSSMNNKSEQTMVDILKMVGVMGAVYACKELRVYLPKLLELAFGHCRRKAVTMVNETVTKDASISQIVFTRDYEKTGEESEIVDAIMDHLCNCKTVKSLAYTTFYTFETTEEFAITHDISGKYIAKTIHDGSITSIQFAIRSRTLNISELRLWALRILEDYKEKRQAGFLLDRYYFNEMTKQGKTFFTMSKFCTTKRLRNLFGEHVRLIEKRIDKFVNNKIWYEEKGVPYSLGFILQGPPGCGKTSMIKAIANDTNRHIINISLKDETTVNYLNKLFFDNQLPMTDGTIRIPVSERLYVIEDADCLTDVLLSREFVEEKDDDDEKNLSYEQKMAQKLMEANREPVITLSHILNILDGVLETPGRIIIMTTNHIEQLDPALKRPGRFDLVIEFKRSTKECLSEMITHFTGFTFPMETLNKYDGKFTPAEIQNILLSNYESESRVLQEFEKLLQSIQKSIQTPPPPPQPQP